MAPEFIFIPRINKACSPEATTTMTSRRILLSLPLFLFFPEICHKPCFVSSSLGKLNVFERNRAFFPHRRFLFLAALRDPAGHQSLYLFPRALYPRTCFHQAFRYSARRLSLPKSPKSFHSTRRVFIIAPHLYSYLFFKSLNYLLVIVT